MDRLKAVGLDVLAVGKINDIFSGKAGLQAVSIQKSNHDGDGPNHQNAQTDFTGFSLQT